MKGSWLYNFYLKEFGTIFAPPWEKLSEQSQDGWNKLAKMVRLFYHDYEIHG